MPSAMAPSAMTAATPIAMPDTVSVLRVRRRHRFLTTNHMIVAMRILTAGSLPGTHA